jgi:SAM-dependent methyltransferase
MNEQMGTDETKGPSPSRDLYHLSAQSWDAKFAAGDHYATDRPFDGLVAVIDDLRARSLARVADLGCGDGRNLALLKSVTPRTVGLDFAEQALHQVRRRPDIAGAPLGLVRGDIGRLPFRSASLDAAVSVWTMNHGADADIRRYIAEMARILRPGGVVFASITGWNLFLAIALRFVARRIRDSSPDGHTYVLDFRSEKGVHHFFTRREIALYFRDWEIVRLDRRRYRTESPIPVPFWNILAEKRRDAGC